MDVKLHNLQTQELHVLLHVRPVKMSNNSESWTYTPPQTSAKRINKTPEIYRWAQNKLAVQRQLIQSYI